MKKIIGFIFNADNIFSRIICSLVYIVVYDLAFNGFVFKLFHYMGIDYIPMPATTYMIWAVISIFPILFYKGIKVLSSFSPSFYISWCIFLLSMRFLQCGELIPSRNLLIVYSWPSSSPCTSV